VFGTNPRKIPERYHAIVRMHEADLAMDTNLEALSGVLNRHDQEMLQRMLARVRKGDFLARVMEIEGLPPLDADLLVNTLNQILSQSETPVSNRDIAVAAGGLQCHPVELEGLG
jgi:hypothetical protein